MNQNFIEEENTVYEIDPDCQIVSLRGGGENRRGLVPLCRGEVVEKGEGEQKKNCPLPGRSPACGGNSFFLILLWLLLSSALVNRPGC